MARRSDERRSGVSGVGAPRPDRIVAWIVVQLAVAATACADASYCDPGLTPRPGHPLAYGPREDRCEGVYVEKVGAANLRLVSLTLDRPTPRFSELRSLDISWRSTRDSELRLRAQSLRPRLYFRMDTVRPSGSRSYAWPLAIANALDLSADEVGLVAWTERSEPSSAPRVYVPVALWRPGSNRDAAAAGGDEAIRLGLLPGRELDEVYVRVARYDEGEDVYVSIQDHTPLRYGYYPAGRLIPVVLKRPPGAGLYVVQIGGTLARGGSTSREFWVQWTED